MSDDLQLNDPQTLYRRWEDSQWSPFAVDLAADRAQWDALADEQRGLVDGELRVARPALLGGRAEQCFVERDGPLDIGDGERQVRPHDSHDFNSSNASSLIV